MSKQDTEFEFEGNYLQRSVASHKTVWLEGVFKGYLVPAVSRGIFNQIRMLRAPSNLTSSVPRDGASTTSVCFTTFIVLVYLQVLVDHKLAFIHHSITHSDVENNEFGVSFVFYFIITRSTKHLLLVLLPQSPK